MAEEGVAPCGHDERSCMCDQCLCYACEKEIKEIEEVERENRG